MTYVYPEDRPRRPHFNWRGLSTSAQLAIFLGAIYLLQVVLALASNPVWIVNTFGLTASPLDWKVVYQILTYAAVHSFDDPLHVVLNAVLLFFCGSVIEAERGPRTMLTIFVAGVLGGGFAFGVLELARGVDSWPLIGASAGCYGLLAAAAVIHPNLLTFGRIPLWVLAGIYVAIDVLRFMQTLKTGSVSAVAYVAHLGGAATGLLLALKGISDMRLERWSLAHWRGRWQGHMETRRSEKAAARARRLDGILEKIHRDGLSALTDSERSFLREVSHSTKGASTRSDDAVTAWMGSDERG